MKLNTFLAAKTRQQHSNFLLQTVLRRLRWHLQLQLWCLSSREALKLPPLPDPIKRQQHSQMHQSLHQQLMVSLFLTLLQRRRTACHTAVWTTGQHCQASSSSSSSSSLQGQLSAVLMTMPAVLQHTLPPRPAPAALAVLPPLLHMTHLHPAPLALKPLQMGLLEQGMPPP
jgi:hypothetical protein